MEKNSFDHLDSTDIVILRTLQQNARLTNKEVAMAAHLSITPTFEREPRLCCILSSETNSIE